MAGNTESINFPTTPGAFDRTYNNNSILPPPFSRDVFVTKFNPNCSKLIYSTYIGGNKSENIVGGIIIDKNFNAYVAGSTLSEDFPVTDGAYDTVFNGQQWINDVQDLGNDIRFHLSKEHLHPYVTCGDDGDGIKDEKQQHHNDCNSYPHTPYLCLVFHNVHEIPPFAC